MEEIKVVCNKCKEEKSISEMRRDPRYKFGVQKFCKLCDNQKNKERREKKKDDEEWQEKERQRKKRYAKEHLEKAREQSKRFREEHKNEYFACEICLMLVRNQKLHEKSQYHQKNETNGRKDDREKKAQEELSHFLLNVKDFIKNGKMNWQKNGNSQKMKNEKKE